MARARHLNNPPIKEALVDIRVAEGPAFQREKLDVLKGDLTSRYPKAEDRRRIQAVLDLSTGRSVSSTKDLGWLGLFLTSGDGTSTAQFRPDGFTSNKLPPYVSADSMFGEALDLWQRYVEVAHPKAVIRLALRYINVLQLPFKGGDDFRRFLTAAPDMPDDSPQRLISDFVTRVTFLDPDRRAKAIVTQQLQLAPAKGGPIPFVIDIDVFQEAEIGIHREQLEPRLQSLRQMKNDLFFSSLTEETLEPYL